MVYVIHIGKRQPASLLKWVILVEKSNLPRTVLPGTANVEMKTRLGDGGLREGHPFRGTRLTGGSDPHSPATSVPGVHNPGVNIPGVQIRGIGIGHVMSLPVKQFGRFLRPMSIRPTPTVFFRDWVA